MFWGNKDSIAASPQQHIIPVYLSCNCRRPGPHNLSRPAQSPAKQWPQAFPSQHVGYAAQSLQNV